MFSLKRFGTILKNAAQLTYNSAYAQDAKEITKIFIIAVARQCYEKVKISFLANNKLLLSTPMTARIQVHN